MGNIGSAEMIVVLGFMGLIALFYGAAIWTLVDAARRPDWQFEVTDQSKTLWIVLPVVGMVFCGVVSIVAFIVYMASVKPQLDRAQPPVWRDEPPRWWPNVPPPPPPPPTSPWPEDRRPPFG